MAILGIDSIVPPSLPGASTWAELITIHVNGAAIRCHRELIDPLEGLTIYTAARKFGVNTAAMTAYSREWTTGKLDAVYWTDPMTHGITAVLVDNMVTGDMPRLMSLVNDLSQIMPMRMAWPNPVRIRRPLPSPSPQATVNLLPVYTPVR